MTVLRDELQGFRQVFLDPAVAFLPGLAVAAEHGRLARGDLVENDLAAVQSPGDAFRQDKPFSARSMAGWMTSAMDMVPYFSSARGESRDGAWHADGQVVDPVVKG